jgi:DHA1 family bicyclomycin/chloramphenicol resistance-like MFS transporter
MMLSPAVSPPGADTVSRRFLIPFCGVLLALVAFSCDILLPAFFDMSRDLGTPIERVQAVIPIFLMAAAVGQLLFGPLSDALGRRPVLLVGLGLFLTGSIVCGLAPSIGPLYVGRALQGTGAACGVVLARAILRDTDSGSALARTMALATAIFSIGPLSAPLIGAGLVALAGWRGTFVAVAAVGMGVIGAAWFRLAETNLAPDRTALQPARLRTSFVRVIRHPQSRFFLGVATLLQVYVVTFVASAPRLFHAQFGLDALGTGVLFAVGATGIVLGQLISNRAIARFGVVPTARVAAALYFIDMVVIALLLSAGALTLPVFVPLLIVLNSSFLVVMANAISLVIDPHREIAGFASSTFGFVSQFAGSLMALLLLPLIEADMGAWSRLQLVICGLVLAATLAYRPAAAALGEPRAEADA